MTNDTKQSKNKLLKYLNFHKEHYKQLHDHYIAENNPDLIRYANEFNGKYKFTKFLIFLIKKGEFDLYD